MPKICIEDGCLKYPSYNFATETKGIYCSVHKKKNMRNIRDKKCIEEGCLKLPSYNLHTETKAIYCNAHKKENMININHIKKQAINCLVFMLNKKQKT